MRSAVDAQKVTTADELIAIVGRYNPRCDHAKIRDAFEVCVDAHQGQKRHSGEAYKMHPVAVAEIIAGMCLDDVSIVTALLHDTIEDTKISYDDICAKFGDEIADLVDGVTKLTNLELSSIHSKQAENFRKLFLAMSRDLRVILVKLADRLHNMRTIAYMPFAKQEKKARETLEIYAPLAGRIGMQEMREELEDLAFEVIKPQMRKSINKRLALLRNVPQDVIDTISKDISDELKKAKISAILKGRTKKAYSIWRKIKEKRTHFHRLSDIYAFRIIVEKQSECYAVLGAMHARWRAVPGRFKDYISHPKANGYRSLHTTISGRHGKYVEIQIRTKQMHEVAENGVAAHWAYRDGERIVNPFTIDPANWVNELNKQMKDSDRHDDFLEQMKLEIYNDSLFVFTPKGAVIDLPRGATALDFAYAIHTRLGEKSAGVKVDGKRVPLWSELETGQTVEIIRAEGQSPNAAWSSYVKTGRAQAAIRRSLREEDKMSLITLGRNMMTQAFERHERSLTHNVLKRAVKQNGLNDENELFFEVGNDRLSANNVVKALFPDANRAEKNDIPKGDELVGIENNASYTLASCCQPLPGERIVGIAKPRAGVTVHAIDCEKLMRLKNDQWIDLKWREGQHPPYHIVTIEVVMGNRSGVLGRLCSLIGSQDVNIADVRSSTRHSDFYIFRFDLELRDNRALYAVITALESDADVASVQRYKDIKADEKKW